MAIVDLTEARDRLTEALTEWRANLIQLEKETTPPAPPQAPVSRWPPPGIKGAPVRVFEHARAVITSEPIDCEQFNALHVTVRVDGTTPVATITVRDAVTQSTLPDPNAVQSAVSANTAFDVVVGGFAATIDLSAISGTFGANQGFTVDVIPYVAPGAASYTGKLITLLPATTITDDTATTGTAVVGLDPFDLATVLLTVASKVMDASTTLDVYVEYSPDRGTTWDDLAHFAQITNAAVGNGTYVLFLNRNGAASLIDRVTDDAATLAANSVRQISWCDRIRIKTANANFAGTDTVTITVSGYFQ